MNFKRIVCMVAAVTVITATFAGCGEKSTTTSEDANTVPKNAYEINWYMQGTTQSDTPAVEAKINEYLKDKINRQAAYSGYKSVYAESGNYDKCRRVF